MVAATKRPAQPAVKRGKPIATPKVPIAAPTAEQQARYSYELASTVDEAGRKAGRAYHRRAWFETLYEREVTRARRDKGPPIFSPFDLRALRYYRDAFEAAERSPIRCALAGFGQPGRGGRSDRDEPTIALARAREKLARVEAGLGDYLATVRAVAIEDKSYCTVAMDRFGYRDVGFDDREAGRYVFKQVPRSGRHREIIQEEFLAGVRLLTETVGRMFGLSRAVDIGEC